MNYKKIFKESWVLMRNKKVLLIILFDFLFLFLLFLFSGIVISNIINNLNILQEKGNILNSNQLENTQESTGFFLQQLNEFENLLSRIFLMVNFLVIGIFLLWCVFQGLNWMMSNNILNKSKIKFKNFLKLSLISLFWFIIVIIFFKLFNTGLIEGLTEQEKTGAGIMIIIFFFIIFYFLSINYSLFLLKLNLKSSIKDTFVLGVKKIYILFPNFLFILLIFLITSLIFYLLRNLFWVFGLFGLIVFLILIAWSRIFILLNLKEFY